MTLRHPFKPGVLDMFFTNILSAKSLLKTSSAEPCKILNKIKFVLDFQICKEICIPVNKDFILDLQPENYIDSKNIEKIKKNLSGKKIIREIYVPGKIVNLVLQ